MLSSFSRKGSIFNNKRSHFYYVCLLLLFMCMHNFLIWYLLFNCYSVFRDTCPMCRVRMEPGMYSPLALSITDLLEYPCTNVEKGCQVRISSYTGKTICAIKASNTHTIALMSSLFSIDLCVFLYYT